MNSHKETTDETFTSLVSGKHSTSLGSRVFVTPVLAFERWVVVVSLSDALSGDRLGNPWPVYSYQRYK